MSSEKKLNSEMPVTSHQGGKKNDADPREEKNISENKEITLQSQKGKKVDADPSNPKDQPTKE